MNLTLTSVGINALLRAMCGDDLIFTNVRIGDGAAQNPATATALANPQKTLTITEMTVSDNNAVLSTSFNNSTVSTGFRMKEVGVYVQDQDDSSKEVLYAYGTEPDETADFIAASDSNIITTAFSFSIFVASAENISAIINETLQYATKAAFDAHVADTSNPHSVTKEQVGLGNVPNVSTNNQTPTYTAPVSTSELTSGEKLSVALGKIARAVSSLISHIGNRSNPHQVTPSQIGASSSGHKHAATDINSGTLGIARGGTGKGSFSKNKILYASATDVLSQLGIPSKSGMALHQDTSGAPYWAFASAAEDGSYVGTGGGGSSTPNSITFRRLPKIIFIKKSGSIAGLDAQYAILFVAAGQGYSHYNPTNASTNNYQDLTVTTSGTTVSWYHTSSSNQQMNMTGKTYYYIGIM
ncbi:MAG: hypothetical protein II437_01485 [Oscillospiraceae bacterium]|nr:hypothetical protein [Oscillospiraceae bacterium]